MPSGPALIATLPSPSLGWAQCHICDSVLIAGSWRRTILPCRLIITQVYGLQPQQSPWAIDLSVPSCLSSPLPLGPYFSANDLAFHIPGGMEPIIQHESNPFPLSNSICSVLLASPPGSWEGGHTSTSHFSILQGLHLINHLFPFCLSLSITRVTKGL